VANSRPTLTKVLAHAAGAFLTLLVVRQTDALLSWLTWQVSSAFGETAGMHFYSMGISAETRVGAILTVGLVFSLPVLIVGTVVHVTEKCRQRWGSRAAVIPLAAAALAGLGVWKLAGGEDVPPLASSVLGVCFALLSALLIAVYWGAMVTVLRVRRARVVGPDIA
jgi:hypothetical protein